NGYFENTLRKVTDLDCRECLDVKFRIKGAQASQKLKIPFTWQGRMKAADHVNFCDPHGERSARRINDLRYGHFECMRIAFPGAKSAELARENANIRIIDVAIQDIGGAISVF